METATFPGRFESLAEISEFVKRAAKAAGLGEDAIYGVELAVDEACSNIIEHAYGDENSGEIQCTCEITTKGFKITLRDKGKAFDPDSVPKPKIDVPLIEREPGGLGLFFISKMMDEVHYEFTPEENILILVKYLHSD